jgi:hypothetical protein
MKRTTIIEIMAILLGICAILQIATASEYQETLSNDFIDGNLDDFYSQQTDQIYYAHSKNRYAFFIEYTAGITSVKINSTMITGNLSSQEIASFVQGNIAEIAISKAILGDNVCFEILINGHESIIIDPQGVLNPPEAPPEEAPPKGIDLVAFFGGVFRSPIFYAIITFMVIFLADYNNHPIVKVIDENGKLKRLGRFITETDEPSINKKKFLFLNSNGIQEIYCDFTFRALDIFNYQRVYVIEWDYPHVLISKLSIPEKAELSKKEFEKTFKNRLIWVLFTIVRFTPFRWVALGLYNRLSYKAKSLKEADYLIPFFCMESAEYHFNITYDQEELNTETNEMEYIAKSQENVLYSDILALKKAQIRNLKIELNKVENIQYPTIKEAIDDKHSRFEIVNTYENKTTNLEVSILDLEKRLQSTYTTIQKQRLEMDQKIRDGLRPMEESNEYLRANFPDMLSNALGFKNVGFSEKQSIEKALTIHLEKNDKEKNELRDELAKLKAKLELLPKKSKFNPNEIVITGEVDE